jgi:hypothetical protein
VSLLLLLLLLLLQVHLAPWLAMLKPNLLTHEPREERFTPAHGSMRAARDQ